ncbi:uncharacterized protein [Ptychodera flava]|uniref:uncharacterized protein n=1 Tax=Ptychodera flava TaxID=63121 RepID=UPI003969FA2F
MRAFPEKYQARTTKGKVELQHDIGILRVAYDNNISKLPQNDDSHVDRREFSKQLQEVGKSVYSSVKQVPSSSKCSADYLQELLKSSPVRSSGQCTSSPESRKTRGRRCDTEQSEKKRRKNKRERSSSDSSGSEYTNIEAEAYDKYMRRQRRDIFRETWAHLYGRGLPLMTTPNWNDYYSSSPAYLPHNLHPVGPMVQFTDNFGDRTRPAPFAPQQLRQLEQGQPRYFPAVSPNYGDANSRYMQYAQPTCTRCCYGVKYSTNYTEILW